MNAASLGAGSVVAVDLGPYWHIGIVTGRDMLGKVLVTSNSQRRGGVYEEALEKFSGGRAVTVVVTPDAVDALGVIQRAHAALGARWDLVRFNCEHFVEWAFGREPKSRQLQQWAVGAGVIALAAFLASRFMK
jgi:hypothetical protein